MNKFEDGFFLYKIVSFKLQYFFFFKTWLISKILIYTHS